MRSDTTDIKQQILIVGNIQMNYSFNVRILSHFYHSAAKAELERRNFPKGMAKKIFTEHKAVVARAKDIVKS